MCYCLNKCDLRQVNDYIETLKGNYDLDEGYLNKLLLSIPDKASFDVVFNLIINKFKKINIVNVDESNIDNIKLKKNCYNFVVIVDALELIKDISKEKFVKYINKFLNIKYRKKNIITIMGLFKGKQEIKEEKIILEELCDNKIDIDKPNIEIINNLINNCKNHFHSLNKIDLNELCYCFKDQSLETIIDTLTTVENDYNDGLINDISYKTYYPYIMKITNKGKYNELNDYDKQVIAYHEIGHFISDYVLNNNYGIISLGGYGDDLGHYRPLIIDDKRITNLNSVKNEIIVCLSGKACTEKILNDTFSGATDDIERARYLYKLLTESAMLGFDKLPPISLSDNSSCTSKYYEEEQRFLSDCMHEAENIVSSNKDKIEEIYSKLVQSNLLFKNDLITIMQK